MSSPALALRLQRNLYLKSQLEELGKLTGRVVLAGELGSIEQFATIRQSAQRSIGQPVTACEIPFLDKDSERFKGFIGRLKAVNSSPVYVITPRAESCGALQVSSLSEIRFDFDFSINEDGILVFATTDDEDRLLLDFSTTSSGEQIMKVETQGANWATIAY